MSVIDLIFTGKYLTNTIQGTYDVPSSNQYGEWILYK